MSVTDELRAVVESVGLAMPQAATLMMEAADTILSLRDRAQDLQSENAKQRELLDYVMPIAWYGASERERDRMRELGRVTGEMEEHHAWAPESHYVMLPKDADGVPIHIGDVMDSKVDYLFDGKPFTVRGLVLCEDGWEVTDGRFGNRYKPDSLRHHHEPTVEDVLHQFLGECDSAISLGYDEVPHEVFAEYAAKFRLSDANAK